MTGHQTLLVLLVELALLVDLALRPTGYAGQLLHATLLLELLGLHLLGGLRLLPGRGSRPTLRGDDAADGGRDAHAAVAVRIDCEPRDLVLMRGSPGGCW